MGRPAELGWNRANTFSSPRVPRVGMRGVFVSRRSPIVPPLQSSWRGGQGVRSGTKGECEMAQAVAAQPQAEDGQGKDLKTMRHSAAHVMAEAVQQLFPDAKFGIGPAIEDGFYYDFDLPRTLTPDDLVEIEKRMKQIAKSNVPFE